MSDVIIPYNERGNPMSPYEAHTGVILPIYSFASREEGQRRNRHHPHFYREDYINGTLAQRAVRFSRLQLVAVGKHKSYHDKFKGTRFPDSLQEETIVTILNYAEYVPTFAVDVSGSSFEVRELSPAEKEELQKPGTFTVERQGEKRGEIGQFLMGCALLQDIPGNAKPTLIDEFLSITPEESMTDETLRAKKLQLGVRLLNKGIGLAVDPVNVEFSEARRRRAIPIGKPVCAWLLVKQYVAGHEPRYVDTLDQKLRVDYGLVSA